MEWVALRRLKPKGAGHPQPVLSRAADTRKEQEGTRFSSYLSRGHKGRLAVLVSAIPISVMEQESSSQGETHANSIFWGGENRLEKLTK
jgi:hypothetical protein